MGGRVTCPPRGTPSRFRHRLSEKFSERGPGRQHQHHLETCWKCTFSAPPRHGRGPAVRVLTAPPADFNASHTATILRGHPVMAQLAHEPSDR